MAVSAAARCFLHDMCSVQVVWVWLVITNHTKYLGLFLILGVVCMHYYGESLFMFHNKSSSAHSFFILCLLWEGSIVQSMMRWSWWLMRRREEQGLEVSRLETRSISRAGGIITCLRSYFAELNHVIPRSCNEEENEDMREAQECRMPRQERWQWCWSSRSRSSSTRRRQHAASSHNHNRRK